MGLSLDDVIIIFQALVDFNLGHDTRAKWLSAPISIMLIVRYFLIRKLDVFSNQSLFICVAFKLNSCTNFQILTVNKVGLAHHNVRATSIIEKPRVLIAEPFLNYCLQNFTSNLTFIAMPLYSSAPHLETMCRYTDSNASFMLFYTERHV